MKQKIKATPAFIRSIIAEEHKKLSEVAQGQPALSPAKAMELLEQIVQVYQDSERNDSSDDVAAVVGDMLVDAGFNIFPEEEEVQAPEEDFSDSPRPRAKPWRAVGHDYD